ncbi:MAG TPA: CHRD domain-containing protein [Gemmatimonadaceae bacterium]|nr:CHRD domain-containing protein [Gemmatimonadaceae bacterium]
MMTRLPAALMICLTAASCETFTDVPGPTHYSAELRGANVKPGAVTSPGIGTLTASWDPVEGILSYTLGYSGLTSAATNGHIHGPANESSVGEILIDFDVPPDGSTGDFVKGALGSATGRIDLSGAITSTVSGDSLVKLLQAGRLYVDLHTSANAAGEIRGQLREN